MFGVRRQLAGGPSAAPSSTIDPNEAAQAARESARAARQAAMDAHEAVGMVERLHRRTLIAGVMAGAAFLMALVAVMQRLG